MLWYPITDRAGPDRLSAALHRSSIRKVLRAELAWPPAEGDKRLAGAGLIIVNPPWRLADELARLLPALGAVLAPSSGPCAKVDWLAPEG